ncbi:hypothetical protein [Pseudomonas mangiferae]|uniref:hypothetical protein n=1 Tax=Pseudomonas mangiferae TaxID=2593654 RepID=UPI0015B4BE62|nr:hypothetical protein [Pseudomonas mangiferae]
MSRDTATRTLNDPDASPADIADERERGQEERRSEKLTGGTHDNQGHAPQIPHRDERA